MGLLNKYLKYLISINLYMGNMVREKVLELLYYKKILFYSKIIGYIIAIIFIILYFTKYSN